jgi:hypothetical protein
MTKCPYCKQEVTINDVHREVRGTGFLKQEIMYSCPHCDLIIGFSRGNYG